jgi:hypothetical protein
MAMHREKKTRARQATLELLAADTVVCDRCHLPMDLMKRHERLRKTPNRVRHLTEGQIIEKCVKCEMPVMLALRVRYVDQRPYQEQASS